MYQVQTLSPKVRSVTELETVIGELREALEAEHQELVLDVKFVRACMEGETDRVMHTGTCRI